METNKEKRILEQSEICELRAIKSDNGERIIEGYGAVFNHKSRLIFDWEGRYFEIIREGAFDRALASEDLDVVMTFNHSNDKILARYTAGRESNTLSLTLDEKGLKYRFSVGSSTLANDVWDMVERGDLSESSFVFSVRSEDQEWETEGEDQIRYINSVSGLYDVSVVWKGAYSNTDVKTAGRHYNEFKEADSGQDEKLRAEETALKIAVDIEHDEMKVKMLSLNKS